MPNGTEGSPAGRAALSAAAPGPGGHAAFLAAGLAATAAQVQLLRELVVDVAGDEAAIGVGLAAWLIGIALGATVARKCHPGAGVDAAPTARAAGLGLAALALLPPLAIVAGRFLPHVLFPNAGELPGLGVTVLLGLATLLPCGAAVGWVFTTLAAGASRVWRGGEAVARLYVVESLGSLAGGVAVTLLAGRLLPLRLSALVGLAAALVALGDGLRLARPWSRPRGSRLVKPWPLAVAAALCALLATVAGPLDARSERARFAGMAPGLPLLASVETPYQHLALGGDEVRHLYASGQYVASFPDPYSAESLGHLVALLAPRPERVLVLGGVERGLVPVLLRHPVARLTLVEPDREAFRFLSSQLPAGDRAALAAPRVSVVHDDPRRFLSRAAAGPFDLVLLLGPDPATLLRARLATVELFERVAKRLSPDGVIVVSLPAAPTLLTGESEALAAALVRSLREALPVVHVTLPGEALAVAGLRPSAVTLDPAALASRWRSRAIVSQSFDAALLPVLLPPERVAEHEAALVEAARRAAPSRDDRPISFLHALARRQQIVSGASGRIVRMAVSAPAGLLVALCFVPSLAVAGAVFGRRRGSASRAAGASRALRARAGEAARLSSHGVAVAGAAGLGWSLLVLFSFQTQAGALYGQLGALVALFMLGLALGGAAVGAEAARFFSRAHSRPEEGAAGDTARHAARVLHVCLGVATAFAVVLPFGLAAAARLSDAGSLAAVLAHGALLLAAGGATGAVFPAAAEVRIAAGESPAAAAGRLETVDHVGAAAAALTGAVVFVPLLGLTSSAFLLAGLLAAALGMSLLAGPAE